MSDEPGFLAKTAIEFLNRQPPPTAEERSVFYANMRRTEADAYEAADMSRAMRRLCASASPIPPSEMSTPIGRSACASPISFSPKHRPRSGATTTDMTGGHERIP